MAIVGEHSQWCISPHHVLLSARLMIRSTSTSVYTSENYNKKRKKFKLKLSISYILFTFAWHQWLCCHPFMVLQILEGLTGQQTNHISMEINLHLFLQWLITNNATKNNKNTNLFHRCSWILLLRLEISISKWLPDAYNP